MASFAAAADINDATNAPIPQRIIKGLEISKETPINEIAEKIYDYWKSQTLLILLEM